MTDITITSLETITAFGIDTGDYLFTLDELQSTSIEQTQESSEITGKGGRKLNSLKRNKAVKISGSNGLVSGGLLEMQTGSKFKTGKHKVMWTDYLTISEEGEGTKSLVATTSGAAVGTTGNEIVDLYIRNSDGTLGKKLEQNADTASGKFTYDPTAKKLTFFGGTAQAGETPAVEADVKAGTEIVVYYMREVSANVLENESDIYSQKCTLYIDALGEDKCAKTYHLQFFIPKADFSGEFTFEMGDNQTVHSFDAESLAGACGTGGQLWTYTVFGVDQDGEPSDNG